MASEAGCHLLTAGPDVLFLHFDDMDHEGHAGGFDPGNANYLSAFNRLDGYIGSVLQAVNTRSSQFGEKWLICVVSDHGGTPGGSHGGQSVDELTVPFILSGGDAIKGTITPPTFNVNLMPTVLTYLGIDLNPAWNLDGQVTGIRTALKISQNGTEVLVRWEGSGLLQWASNLSGPWNDLSGVTSPHTNALTDSIRFYRLKY